MTLMTTFQIWFRETPDGEWQCLHHPGNEGGTPVLETSREAAERWRVLVQERMPLGETEIREAQQETSES